MSKCNVCGSTCPVCNKRTQLVASDLAVGTAVQFRFGHKKFGQIIANDMIQGNEVVAIEYRDGSVDCQNCNDLLIK
jgi:hypothetical protein